MEGRLAGAPGLLAVAGAGKTRVPSSGLVATLRLCVQALAESVTFDADDLKSPLSYCLAYVVARMVARLTISATCSI
jgi:hypothetical protein